MLCTARMRIIVLQLKPEEAKQVFLRLLEESSLKADALQLRETWGVFKQFGKMPVIENGSLVPEYFSWECAAPQPDENWLAFACMMRAMGTFAGRGEIEEMCCFLQFEVADELRLFTEPEQIQAGSIEEFAELVERAISFRLLLQRRAVSSTVGQGPL